MPNDEPTRIKHFAAPLSSSVAHDLVVFLKHKGAPWIDDIRRRVRAERAGAEDHFFLEYAADRITGHAWYNVAGADTRLGVLGHLYTHPDFRRQGIAKRLLQTAMVEFRQRGGEVMQLFTSTAPTISLYEQLGFENLFQQAVYHEQDWYMRYPTDAAATVQQWLAASDLQVRDLVPGDLPYYCLLFNIEHDSVLKDRAQQIGSGLEAELAFIEMLQATSDRRAICCVLDNGQMMVGTASLVAHAFPHQSHVGLFDIYVCPTARPHLSNLAQSCLQARERIGLEKIYAMSVDAAKYQLLQELGFEPCATLPNHYRVVDRDYDCQLLEWK